MSVADEVRAQLKTRRARDSGFQGQLERYRAFKEAMAEAGVRLSRHRYDIPLMERMGLRKRAESSRA